ncbi:hypothetical protein ACFVYT_09415 [Streptomyces sp. NPDC058290]|uniref:hypothetical protein n=1 Tax=Streptomyces sp. NPDC058290 TaxID=3346426 RepID=UPI0036E49C0E
MSESQTNKSPTVDGLQEISEMARERREKVTEGLEATQPDFILEVLQSEVRIVLHPPMGLPFTEIDPTDLAHRMEDTYGSTVGPIDLGPLLQQTGREELAKISMDDALKRLVKLQNGHVVLRFAGGKFPVKYDFVPLISTVIDFESILVRASGTSSVAELVGQEVAEMVWASAGAEKRWTEIQSKLQLVGYATATKVDLGFPVEKLVSADLDKFFTEQVLAGEKFAGAMGDRSYRHNYRPSREFFGNVHLDELHMRVKKYDPLTGDSDTFMVKFSVMARGDYGRGLVRITSELPYDTHVHFVKLLREYVHN